MKRLGANSSKLAMSLKEPSTFLSPFPQHCSIEMLSMWRRTDDDNITSATSQRNGTHAMTRW